jgi:two-component system CheB/CheR fusion protein
MQGLLMVVFREVTLPKEQKPGKASTPSRKIVRHVADLEHELKSAKEQLQTTIEELETANQELGSTNEELTTINTELQIKADESAEVSNDMNNLIASTQIANIFLDGDLRIKRFTPATADVLSLVETDIGRPCSDFSLKLDYPELLEDVHGEHHRKKEYAHRTLDTRNNKRE